MLKSFATACTPYLQITCTLVCMKTTICHVHLSYLSVNTEIDIFLKITFSKITSKHSSFSWKNAVINDNFQFCYGMRAKCTRAVIIVIKQQRLHANLAYFCGEFITVYKFISDLFHPNIYRSLFERVVPIFEY